MSDGAAPRGPHAMRAADDFAAIRTRLDRLNRPNPCSCVLYRNGDGTLRHAETDPTCPLHGPAATYAAGAAEAEPG